MVRGGCLTASLPKQEQYSVAAELPHCTVLDREHILHVSQLPGTRSCVKLLAGLWQSCSSWRGAPGVLPTAALWCRRLRGLDLPLVLAVYADNAFPSEVSVFQEGCLHALRSQAPARPQELLPTMLPH